MYHRGKCVLVLRPLIPARFKLEMVLDVYSDGGEKALRASSVSGCTRLGCGGVPGGWVNVRAAIIISVGLKGVWEESVTEVVFFLEYHYFCSPSRPCV